MLTCKQIIDLASKELDTSIPWVKRLQMKTHLFICKNCQQYIKQISVIHKLSAKLDDSFKSITLPDDAKQRIKEYLKRHENH